MSRCVSQSRGLIGGKKAFQAQLLHRGIKRGAEGGN
jgi:hypothetical protein